MTLKSPTSATGMRCRSNSAAWAARRASQRSLYSSFGPWRWIAIGQVEASDQHAVDSRFDIAAVLIVGVTRESTSRFDRLSAAAEDRNAVPAFLAVPYGAIAGLLQRKLGETRVGCL